MSKMSTIEKINKIKNDRILVLNTIKERITLSNSGVNDNVSMALEVLKFDDNNTKEYEAILKAQDLINDLTKQIINAKTVEEVNAIRNKLNYYINKVKKEYAKRNINEN